MLVVLLQTPVRLSISSVSTPQAVTITVTGPCHSKHGKKESSSLHSSPIGLLFNFQDRCPSSTDVSTTIIVEGKIFMNLMLNHYPSKNSTNSCGENSLNLLLIIYIVHCFPY